MKKIVVLISHNPNPRILKRVIALENDFTISLIYWDRGYTIKRPFEISSAHNVVDIHIKAPQGKALKRVLPFIKFMLVAMKNLKVEKPDIIHAGNLDMLFISHLYKKIFNRKTKIVYEVGDLPKYAFVKKATSIKNVIGIILQKIEKWLIKDISKLIVTSPYFWKEYFCNFTSENKYLFIPNAPSEKLFDKYNKKENKNFTIGFIGSVRYANQLKMLIDVIGELDQSFRILIAGTGPDYNDILQYSIQKDYVDIYGPYNYEKEIVELYEKVDMTYAVYDTKLENVKIALPNRLYESIVCEIPIIGTKDTALGDFIQEKNIGINIKDDKVELKEVLMQLINNPEKVKRYKENCRKIKLNYYYEKNSRYLLEEYLHI